MILKTVTIPVGETDSEVIELKDSNIKLSGLLFKTLTSATTFNLKVSLDGTTFYPMLDSAGAEAEFNLLSSGDCYVNSIDDYTEGIDYFKVSLASSAAGADALVTPIGRRLLYP